MNKLKKTILFILLSIYIILLPSCSTNNLDNYSNFDYNTDMQIFYHRNGTNVPMTKSDTGYYYVGDDNIVIYVDKESKKATPLCYKPNCLHDDKDTCDAYFNLSEYIPVDMHLGTVIQYHNNYLYMVCGEYDESNIQYHTYLMRCNKDGSERKQITDYFKHSFYDWFIHRGFFYYTSDKSIFRISIDSPKEEPEIVYECNYYFESSMDTFQLMCAYDNYLYVTVDENDAQGNGRGLIYTCINLDTLESNKLPVYESYPTFYREFVDNNLIMQYFDKSTQEFVFLKSELDGSDAEEFYREKKSLYRILSCDGNYFYFDNAFSMYNNLENQKQTIYVYDRNMNEIDSFMLPETNNAFCDFFNPQDDEYFLLEKMVENNERILCIADKSQIGSLNGKTIECTELCKLDWYENEQNPYVYTVE